MSSSNNRTINGYETIDGELVLSEITNSVLATDSDGLVYGKSISITSFHIYYC